MKKISSCDKYLAHHEECRDVLDCLLEILPMITSGQGLNDRYRSW
jgi:hypothetical protein